MNIGQRPSFLRLLLVLPNYGGIVMTSSELNYLIKLDLLRKDNEIVRMTMLAKEAGVSKPSMLQALEKFEKMNILKKDDKNILFTEEGKKMFDDYKR